MMKEQINPMGIIELTDEELQGMRGGCHHDDDCDSGCDDGGSRRGFRDDGGRRFDFEERFSFRDSERFSFRNW